MEKKEYAELEIAEMYRQLRNMNKEWEIAKPIDGWVVPPPPMI